MLKKKGLQKQNAIEQLSAKGNLLIDIAACYCEFDFCTCPEDNKCHVLNSQILDDKRSKREMVIETVDKEASESLRQKRIRNEKR